MGSNDEQAQQKSASVGKAWVWLLVLTGGMTLLGFTVWDSLGAAPSWFHALFGFQALWAIVGVVNAYKRQANTSTSQEPL